MASRRCPNPTRPPGSIQAPADPFNVEGISADDERSEDLANESDGARLRFAAPNAGHARLSQPGPAFLIHHTDEHVLAAGVLAERADDGQVRNDVPRDRLRVDRGDAHTSPP